MRRELLLTALSVAVLGCPHHSVAPDACTSSGTGVLVQSRQHRLLLCEDGRTARSFRASLGRGGVGKKLEGDNRTPLGLYALEAPRESKPFHRFIPVAYPTDEQRAKGFTGGAIGIHGPPRWSRHLGRVNGWFDWTRGCIAVNRDGDVDAITRWIAAHRDVTIEIR